jgi:hypothetical protein
MSRGDALGLSILLGQLALVIWYLAATKANRWLLFAIAVEVLAYKFFGLQGFGVATALATIAMILSIRFGPLTLKDGR